MTSETSRLRHGTRALLPEFLEVFAFSFPFPSEGCRTSVSSAQMSFQQVAHKFGGRGVAVTFLRVQASF